MKAIRFISKYFISLAAGSVPVLAGYNFSDWELWVFLVAFALALVAHDWAMSDERGLNDKPVT